MNPASTPSTADPTIYQRPAALLQNLIRFDTTNPPGNEAPCVAYIKDLLAEAGFEPILLARDPDRPNLIARLHGRGEAPPLLLYEHVDVVTTANQRWTHPPFEGKEVDDSLYGLVNAGCVAGGNYQVTGLGDGEHRSCRIRVPHLANQDDVGVLPQDVTESIRE